MVQIRRVKIRKIDSIFVDLQFTTKFDHLVGKLSPVFPDPDPNRLMKISLILAMLLSFLIQIQAGSHLGPEDSNSCPTKDREFGPFNVVILIGMGALCALGFFLSTPGAI